MLIRLLAFCLLFVSIPIGLASEDGLGIPEPTGGGSGIIEELENEMAEPSPDLLDADSADEDGASIIEEAMEMEDNDESLLEDIEPVDAEETESVVEAADDDLPSPTEVFFSLQTLFYLTIGLFLLFPLLALVFSVLDKVKEFGKEAKEELKEDLEKHPEKEGDHELKDPEELIEDARKAIDELPK